MENRYVVIKIIGGFVTGVVITDDLEEAKDQADEWGEEMTVGELDDSVIFDRKQDDVIYSGIEDEEDEGDED